MTREEAVKLLADARYADDLQGNNDLQTAHIMAMKALEQEPCEDCISRQAVLDLAEKGFLISNGNFESVCKAINEIPSAKTQEPKTDVDRAKAEMLNYSNAFVLAGRNDIASAVSNCITIIDKYRKQEPKAGHWSIKDVANALEGHGLLEQEPCREQDNYENEIEDLHNRLDIAEYDKERLKEEVARLEGKIKALEQKLCADCISRQAVLDILDDMTKNYIKENNFDKAQGVAWVKVQKLPSVTPQPKTGHWIKLNIGYGCSECSLATNEYGKLMDRYCPNCGAKMEG